MAAGTTVLGRRHCTFKEIASCQDVMPFYTCLNLVWLVECISQLLKTFISPLLCFQIT